MHVCIYFGVGGSELRFMAAARIVDTTRALAIPSLSTRSTFHPPHTEAYDAGPKSYL